MVHIYYIIENDEIISDLIKERKYLLYHPTLQVGVKSIKKYYESYDNFLRIIEGILYDSKKNIQK